MKRSQTEAFRRFVVLMRAKLRENEHKGDWDGCTTKWLLGRLHEETDELVIALSRIKLERLERGGVSSATAEEVAREAADIANFAMMIADVVGGLETVRITRST